MEKSEYKKILCEVSNIYKDIYNKATIYLKETESKEDLIKEGDFAAKQCFLSLNLTNNLIIFSEIDIKIKISLVIINFCIYMSLINILLNKSNKENHKSEIESLLEKSDKEINKIINTIDFIDSLDEDEEARYLNFKM